MIDIFVYACTGIVAAVGIITCAAVMGDIDYSEPWERYGALACMVMIVVATGRVFCWW